MEDRVIGISRDDDRVDEWVEPGSSAALKRRTQRR
jgi:hypothetical protein